MPRKTYEFAELDVEVLLLLKRLGYEPRVIFDVGASNGFWSYHAHRAFPDAEYHLFEPLVDHVPEYKKLMEQNLRSHPSFVLHKLALGENPGVRSMSVFPGGFGSTTIAIGEGHPDVSLVAVPVRSLDDVVRELRLPTPQVIKMDVQGAELSILKGAGQLLPEVDVILAECWLWRGYGQNTPLLLEVASWLAGHGFCLWEVGDAYREPDGVLAHLDCFFVNSRTMARALGHRLSLPLLVSHGRGSGEEIDRLLRILQVREAEIAAMRGSRVWKLRERWLALRARLGLRR